MGTKPIIINNWRDLPPMAASIGNMFVNKTGSWRNVEPHYIEQIPPCNHLCPAGNDVVGFVTLAAEGRFEEAFLRLAITTPFPSVCGRVCPHPCETECNRKFLGDAINIHQVERFLGDRFLENPPFLKPQKSTGKSVAIIGTGPAGLSAAYHLALRGVDVTMFEEQSAPGGLMIYGIPDYRLPQSVLRQEIERIINLGVKINCNIRVGSDVKIDELLSKYDAVLTATGFTKSKALGVKNDTDPVVVSGLNVLRNINFGQAPTVGERVLVVGGGNTAMDVARSLLRLGKDVRVVYRRTKNEMPAIAEEIEALENENIPIDYLTTPVEILYENGEFKGTMCIRMELGEPDSSGRRRPVPVKGSEFLIETDTVVTAIGEDAELDYLPDELRAKCSWNIPADPLSRTIIPNLFACGDVADGAGTVTAAIGYGRKAAIGINAYLNDETIPDEMELKSPSFKKRTKHIVRFEDLNTAYFKELERLSPIELPVPERINSFDEVIGDFNEIEVLKESKRCFSCGTCPSCDNCWIFCPDAVITPMRGKNGKLYEVNFDYCKGCGVCAAECPRFCIEMRPVH